MNSLGMYASPSSALPTAALAFSTASSLFIATAAASSSIGVCSPLMIALPLSKTISVCGISIAMGARMWSANWPCAPSKWAFTRNTSSPLSHLRVMRSPALNCPALPLSVWNTSPSVL